MSSTATTATIATVATATVASTDIARVARASIAFGRKRGYYRVLFEAGPVDAATFAELAGVPEADARAWLAEQVAAGVLRVVPGPATDREELLLPGEYVPILLGDHGEPELAGARALLDEHRHELPHVLEGLQQAPRRVDAHAGAPLGVEVERARAFADVARLARLV
ncbi:hypothetical protein [Agromyces mariniharenae]|uniref:hypothetical protein n=1 Tax=Agromyces mariniharenae TaxID=2604423 RepID=UPI001652E161|nr:hypothetical protein [Agromyces mariniharenae]